jgi:hypothetical protein
MNEQVQQQINNLAYHLWISAGREYGRALQYWMMADQMVWELAVASARLSGSAMEVGAAVERTAPVIAAKCVQQIRELAYCMWKAAGAECGRAMDFWMTAERHVTTMLMVPGAMAGVFKPEPSAEPADAESTNLDAERNTEPVYNRFSAEAYLNAIRTAAYYIWEKAGREYGKDPLMFWLEAERQMLHRLEAAAMAERYAPEPANPDAALPPLQPDTSETLSASGSGNAAAAATMEPSPFRVSRLNAVQGSLIH